MKKGQATESCNDVESDRDGDDGKEKLSMANFIKWTDYSFVELLRVVCQITGYPSLRAMYKILSSIAVTSCTCTAERCLSTQQSAKLQITRKRLRSTMRDEWFSSLTILAL